MTIKTSVRLKRIPALPEIVFLKKNQAAVCPNCGAWVTLRAKKKDGTVSGLEWANHYEREHM